MEVNNTTFLKITNITWEKSKKAKKELPEDLELQWNRKDYDNAQISDWISEYFKVKVISLNIKELENKTSSG